MDLDKQEGMESGMTWIPRNRDRNCDNGLETTKMGLEIVAMSRNRGMDWKT